MFSNWCLGWPAGKSYIMCWQGQLHAFTVLGAGQGFILRATGIQAIHHSLRLRWPCSP